MGITDGYINNRWFIVLEMPPAALHAAREFSYNLQEILSSYIYWNGK
jgi:hypothetical protein